MQFESLSAALAMDGHGVYVWFVFVVAALFVIGLLVVPARRSARIVKERLVATRAQYLDEARTHASGS